MSQKASGTIGKDRFELFSDGVFAIILTLLVLDLEVPPDFGLAGLREAMPGLLVHAGAFFVIGMAWITHHQFLEHIERIGPNMLGYNLLVLSWITLVPYGARTAAEQPHDGLGAAMMVACVTMSLASSVLMASFGDFASLVHDPIIQPLRPSRRIYFLGYILLGTITTGLCFVSPWFGYAFLTLGGAALVTEPVSAVHARLSSERAEQTPD